ncbi:peptide chain release factor N(5)-glutamine methyltransferase [Conexibacter sp. SYSU D00693]|uniref:peptide chain release factor N(5)-glutamine methyltransferase n=1 Tax=Conexibacter sp. SYSU D00693 TaxID=2812560 RepID=UPI00196A261D|nr:peptide chain release factor N(5)-glutamine methyltransferase [Conexibacter sp. SYSU D00693]
MARGLQRGTPAREALDSALVALRAAGLDTPRLDAELLVAHALGGVDRAALITQDLEVAGDGARWLRDAVRRRAVERVPVAYLVGHKGFRRLELEVDERVLVPRPETEHLVEAALEDLPPHARVHDVGTGSGAVALALADERPDLVVSASDLSEDALAVARSNAARLGLADRVTFSVGDLLAGVDAEHVVANLPYVEEGATLAPELGHEPRGALFSGPDGLDALRRFAAQAQAAPVRWVALEHGAGQSDAVRALFAGWAGTRAVQDLAGHDRVVVAWR